MLARNPAWKQSTDPLRHQYVDKIVVNIGGPSAQTQLADIEAGTADVLDDTLLHPSEIPTCWPPRTRLPHLARERHQPYMVFNLRSPNNGGAMGKLPSGRRSSTP